MKTRRIAVRSTGRTSSKSGRIIFVKFIVYDSLKDLSHNRNYTNLAVIIQIGAFSLFDRGITFVDLPHDVLENFCGGRKIRMRHLISTEHEKLVSAEM